MNKALTSITAAAVFLFAGFALSAGCVISTGSSSFLSIGDQEHVSRGETHALTLAEGGTLEIELPSGDVVVRADAVGAPELKAVIKAYGKTSEAAQKALDGTQLALEPTLTGMRVRLTGEAIDARKSGVHGPSPRADVELRIPRDVRLAVDLGAGDVQTRGPIGTSKLKSQYGDVRVESAKGDLRMETSSGELTLGGLKGAQSFVARSDYGNVSAGSVEAVTIEMHTSSGSVELADATSTRVDLDSDYGKIVLRRVGGDVAARTSSGSIDATELSGTRATLKSEYGAITVRGLRGELKAATSSGSVNVEGFEGDCELDSDYGHIRATGRFDRFVGATSSGSVNVEALAGSTLSADWALKSGYGHVTLSLPRDLGFLLEAKTDYGQLDVQFPVTIEAGALKNKSALRGQVGTGGKRLLLETSSGNIGLKPGEQR